MEIQKAQRKDAVSLTELTIRSKAHWGYKSAQIEKWRAELTITEKYIDENHMYKLIVENILLGFYAYQSENISERHRHRYEFNNDYLEQIEAAGMKATGTNPKTGLVEVVEVTNHPWFVGVQYHPEYKSTVLKPHPLFVDFIKAALKQSKI